MNEGTYDTVNVMFKEVKSEEKSEKEEMKEELKELKMNVEEIFSLTIQML